MDDFKDFDDDIYKVITAIDGKVKKAVEESMEEGLKIARKNTPNSGMTYSERQKRAGKRAKSNTSSIQNSLAISKVKKTEDGYLGSVYYDRLNGWRAHFASYGTIKQRAQDYINKSTKEIKESDERIMERLSRRLIE